MNRTLKYKLCRLCLCGGGQFIDIFEEDNKLEFMVEKAIEDLLNLKVVKETMYPWLVCSPCLTKLTEFRLFKRRCVECQFVFQNRFEKGDFSEVGDWSSIQEKVTVKTEDYGLNGQVESNGDCSGDEYLEDQLQNQNISVEESVYKKASLDILEG
ncbi:uncharacterized protein [Hetaerina americana]|uniref:uncharacterized protein n=1 Tax=Hetaerina americana TaxID=62018 RepID=UPI003A7F222D